MMKQQQFESHNRDTWEAFEDVLGAMEKGRKTRATVNSQQFTQYYRQICQLLATAQERRYSPYLIDHLNDLALRGHQHMYRRRTKMLYSILEFFVYAFPNSVRQHWRYIAVASIAFYGPLFGMGIFTYFFPDLVFSVYDHSQVSDFSYMYDPQNSTLGTDRGSRGDFEMFGFYIYNNIGIGFRCFASGILFCIGSLFFLVYNGLAIGTVAGYLTELGYSSTFYSFVCGHGAFELTGITISGAAGLRLGFSIIAPGAYTRMESIKRAGKACTTLVFGIIFMLLIAAFIEAFWSSSADIAAGIKYGVAGVFWATVLLYFIYAGRQRGSE